MHHTTTKELVRLADCRRLQVQSAELKYRREEGCAPPLRPEFQADIARLEIVNGEVDVRCVRVGLLAKWAATLPPDATAVIEHEPGALRVRCGSSFLRLLDYYHEPDSRDHSKRGPIGELIRFVAGPGEIGELVVQFDASTLDFSKADIVSARKRDAYRSKTAKLNQKLEFARERLQSAVREFIRQRAILGSMTGPEALAFSRRVRDAKRMLARAVRTPELCPDWLPETTTHTRFEWCAEAGEHRDKVEVENCREEHAALAANYLAAVAAVKGYKPRMSRKSKWGYAIEPTPIYGPAFTKLTDAEKRVRESLESFMRRAFAVWCDANGVKCAKFDVRYRSEGSPRARSGARLAVRNWPAEKASLVQAYREAYFDARDYSRAGFHPGEYQGFEVTRDGEQFRAVKQLDSGESVEAFGDTPGRALAKAEAMAGEVQS